MLKSPTTWFLIFQMTINQDGNLSLTNFLRKHIGFSLYYSMIPQELPDESHQFFVPGLLFHNALELVKATELRNESLLNSLLENRSNAQNEFMKVLKFTNSNQKKEGEVFDVSKKLEKLDKLDKLEEQLDKLEKIEEKLKKLENLENKVVKLEEKLDPLLNKLE